MPFTFAHPLFAAPIKLLKPKYISLTGIILGSMAPDFEYFIALEPYQSIGHSIEGLFIQAIPLSILLAFVFHHVIKTPLADNLPSLFNMDNKAHGLLQNWKLGNLISWAIFIASVIIGFYSHVLLDAFTHQSGLFVIRYPFFQENVMSMPIYKLLQYALSFGGLLIEATILIFVFNKIPMNQNYARVESRVKARYWAIVVLVTISTVTLKLIISSSTNYAGILIVSPISGFFLGLVLSSVIYHFQAGRLHP